MTFGSREKEYITLVISRYGMSKTAARLFEVWAYLKVISKGK